MPKKEALTETEAEQNKHGLVALSKQQGMCGTTINRGWQPHHELENKMPQGLQEKSEGRQGQTLTSWGVWVFPEHDCHLQPDLPCLG